MIENVMFGDMKPQKLSHALSGISLSLLSGVARGKGSQW